MKKFLLGIAMLLAAGTSFAQGAYWTTTPSNFTIKAGETMDVCLTLNVKNNTDRMKYDAFQTVIVLPEGFEFEPLRVNVTTIEDWDDEIGDFVTITTETPVYVEKQSNLVDTDARGQYASMSCSIKKSTESESGFAEMVIVEFTTPNDGKIFARFPNALSADLAKFRIKATDKAYTGDKGQIKETSLNVYTTGESEETPNADFLMDYRVEAVIGTSGYATFSWPVPVDFSDFAGKARIATSDALADGFVSRVAITKVPANTGVILEGDAGSSLLSTTREATDDAKSNILVSTADGPVTVGSADKFFALAKHDKGVGFYRCNKDVVIPQYKAYINSSANADAFLFEETTGISNVEATADNAEVYTISGVKVEKAAQKGIYIVNGKKVVVK